MAFHHMRLGAAVVGMVAGFAGSLHAAAAVYDFSNLTPGVVPSAGQYPAPAGTSFQGSYTQGSTQNTAGATGPQGVGVIGPDNWVWTSSQANSFPAIVRNDTMPGMTGTYISAYPTQASGFTGGAVPPFDSINSRKNNANFSYAASGTGKFTVSFITTVGVLNYTTATPTATSALGRAQVSLGFDQNNDGDIRGDANGAENAEVGPQFGIEPTPIAGTGNAVGAFYLRKAAFNSTTYTAPAQGAGTYLIQLEIDPTVNPFTQTTNIYGGNDGAGVFSAVKLLDENGVSTGNTVPQVITLSGASANGTYNLGLSNMNAHNSTNVGTVNGSNPAYWNGFLTRVSNNGAIDTVTITPEPASLAAIAGAGISLMRRRR